MNHINIQPTNPAALEAITVISGKIDKRLAIPEADKVSVVSYLLAHRHQASINITNHQKLMQALLDAEVVGRAKGKAEYFLKPTYQDLQQLTFQSDDDGTLHCYPVSKSGLWCKSKAAAWTLDWPDIAGLGYGAAFYIQPVCAFHGRWASIPRDRGHSFHGIVGSHSTRKWAAWFDRRFHGVRVGLTGQGSCCGRRLFACFLRSV